MPDGDGFTPLMHASIDGQEKIAQLLLEFKANPNLQDRNGASALHYAAKKHSVNIMELLLRSGAKVDIQDKFGNTPLWGAVFESRGRGEAIKTLLRAGANPDLKNLSGVSPRELAGNIGNYNVAQFL